MPSTKTFEIEESIEEQKARVENFKVKIQEQLGEWRTKLTALKEAGKKYDESITALGKIRNNKFQAPNDK